MAHGRWSWSWSRKRRRRWRRRARRGRGPGWWTEGRSRLVGTAEERIGGGGDADVLAVERRTWRGRVGGHDCWMERRSKDLLCWRRRSGWWVVGDRRETMAEADGVRGSPSVWEDRRDRWRWSERRKGLEDRRMVGRRRWIAHYRFGERG